MSKKHCCEMMTDQVKHVCEQHKDPFQCPDNLIYYSALGDYGIIIHDGGSARIEISFCPWCGTKL